jgi:hypothetical protein
MMRALSLGFLFAATLALSPRGVAQTGDPALSGGAEVGVVVQQYTVGSAAAVEQRSVPLSAAVRHRSGFGLSAYGVYASVQSDDLAPLSGLGDLHLGASFLRNVGGAAVEASLGATLPTGQGALSDDLFATAATIAFDDFAFATPSLGQGAALSPALTVALPLGRGAALGVGASYASRAAYAPFEGDTSAYAPADEVALTAGLTALLGGANSVTLDVSMVRYGDDTFRGRTYSPGDKVAATALWMMGSGAVRGRILARYRQVFDGFVGQDDRPVAYLRPSQATLGLGLVVGSAAAAVDLSGTARYYGTIKEIEGLSDVGFGEQQVLLDLGVSPRVAIGAGARLRGAFTYTTGLAERVEEANAPAFTGFRAALGLGLTW